MTPSGGAALELTSAHPPEKGVCGRAITAPHGNLKEASKSRPSFENDRSTIGLTDQRPAVAAVVKPRNQRKQERVEDVPTCSSNGLVEEVGMQVLV